MRIREILFEYDRTRATQALGDKLWQAWMQDYYEQNNKPFDVFLNSWFYKNAIPSPNQQRDMVNRVMMEIESVDPTPNKKYTQWMARQFAIRNVKKLEDVLSTLASAVTKFHLLNVKKKLPPGENDINRYRTPDELYNTMDKYEDPTEESEDKGKARKVYEDGQVTVIVPDDQTAACRYGRNTKWCTAAVHGMNYFNEYNSQGPLYIVIPKKPADRTEKYQLHFPTHQYMNEEDDPIDIGKFIKEQYPELGKWFMSQPHIAARLNNLIELVPDQVIEELTREIYDITWEHYIIPQLTDMEANDNYYRDFIADKFTDEDGNIDWASAPTYAEYDPDVQQWMDDIEKIVKLDAKSVREIAKEIESTDVSDLGNIISWWAEKELEGSYQRRKNLSQWLEINIIIQENPLRAEKVQRRSAQSR